MAAQEPPWIILLQWIGQGLTNGVINDGRKPNNTSLDLLEDKFPMESWQSVTMYTNHFLNADEKLFKRGQEAISATYHGLGWLDVRVTMDEGSRERVYYVREDAN